MTSYEFRKMILANEIKKCKARVGMAIVDELEKKDNSDMPSGYLLTLDEIVKKLGECVDLLSQ